MNAEPSRSIVWLADTLATLRGYSVRVRQTFGHALRDAQFGRRHAKTKVLRGFGGAGVLEIVESDSRGSFRLVYTLFLEEHIYVLHVFQKKAKKGIQTPKHVIDLIKARLREAQRIEAELETDA